MKGIKLATFAALLFGGASGLEAQQAAMPKGTAATIEGTVIDVSCKFGQGLSGDSHKMCAEVCSDAGLPLAILGDDGVLYLATTAEMPGKNQNEKLRPFAERRVRVQGKVFSAGGAKAIQITSIRAA